MATINGVNVKDIIAVLKHSLPILNNHRKSYKTFNNDRDRPIDAALYETFTKHIEQINWLIPTLESINKSTVYFPKFIDALALKDALERYLGENNVSYVPYWNDPTIDPFLTDTNPDYYILKFTIERVAMDGNGFHVGYEHCSFAAKTIKKSELKLSGIPYNLSPHCVNLDSFEIVNPIITPDEELPTIDSHDNDCDVFKRDLAFPWNPDNESFPDDCTCGCNDEWNGYTPPDDDFWWQEMEGVFYYIMNHNQLPDAVFNKDDGTWSIGDQVTWQVGDPEFVWID